MTTPTNPPAGDMTAPSEGRRTRLGEVIYGAMFEVQIDLRYGGAEKAEYIADAVRRALEEAEPGDHPDYADAALDAVRDALTSDDPDVVRAMAVRIGLNVSTRTVYEAARRDSLDTDGQPTVFRFGQDRPWQILEAIRRRELGLSPETHICMGAIQTSASVSMRSPWREVPDAEA